MKYTTVALAAIVGFCLVSCNENEPPKAQPKNSFFKAMEGGTVTYSPNVANQPAVAPRPGLDLSGLTVTGQPAPAPVPVEPVIQIPADARWTVACASVAGPDRFARVAQLKSALMSRTGLKDWYVIHNEQDSTLFYGFYSSVERSKPESARAHADLKLIQNLKDDQGDRMFATSFFSPMVQPDPVAPAEWNLTNSSPKAYWSLQISAYRDNPLRKQAAVEQVRELRAKGVEAYFYHGQSISSVCIGAWSKEAVKEQEKDMGRSISPEDAILVSNIPLPEKYRRADMKTSDGQKIRAFAERIEIADPSLQATMTEYPDHWVNYQRFAKTVKAADGTNHEQISPSFLVIIPHSEPSALSGGGGAPGLLNQVGPAPVQQDPMHQTGTGRLRGLGGN